jgi:putative hemolysin
MQLSTPTTTTNAALRSEQFARVQVSTEGSQFTVKIADTRALIEAAQRLRYRVFVDELGADIDRHDGRDVDQFDALCDHLVVIDEQRDKVVGTYRILPPWGARSLGQRYCETEFRIDALRSIQNELFEAGRACIHPAYRSGHNGAVLAHLWSGLGRYVSAHNVKYLGGCTSVALERGAINLAALRTELLAKHLAPIEYRIEPIRNIAHLGSPEGSKPAMPALLRAYLRMGAWVCGEPAWDPQFDVADFFVLLPVQRIAPRYAKHFLGGATTV